MQRDWEEPKPPVTLSIFLRYISGGKGKRYSSMVAGCDGDARTIYTYALGVFEKSLHPMNGIRYLPLA